VPELRHDVLTGRLVLLATGRDARPNTFRGARPGPRAAAAGCPFCPGHEHETPPEVMRVGPGAPDTPGWRVRVVPNLYPIVGGPDAGVGATGAHEVVILSPDHDTTFGDLDDDQAVETFLALRDRARVHTAAGRAHVQLLVNEGLAAGASIEHPHAQLLALDFVPPAVTVGVDRFVSMSTDPVLADREDAFERSQEVVAGEQVAAWCPTGAASPYETRIAVIDAGARFQDASDGAILGAAIVLRDVLAAIGRVLDQPGARVAYNVVVHNGPGDADRYHWWIAVVPRIAVVAGFEMATAVLVNTVDPATAARHLRAVA
jgi:UDPglucose--hexose-1-phosphate uridylyltransferase